MAQKRIGLIQKNRELLLIDNRDPDAELRALTTEVRKIEGDISLAKRNLHKICTDERNGLIERKNFVWAQLADDVVVWHRVTLANIATALMELQVSLETLSKRRDEIPTVAEQIDAELRRFDGVIEKVGAPGNFRFGPDGALTAILRRALDDCFRRSGVTQILDKMSGAEKPRRELNEKTIRAGLGLTDTPPLPKPEF